MDKVLKREKERADPRLKTAIGVLEEHITPLALTRLLEHIRGELYPGIDSLMLVIEGIDVLNSENLSYLKKAVKGERDE